MTMGKVPGTCLALGSLSGSSVCRVLPAHPAVPGPDGAEQTGSLPARTQCSLSSSQVSLSWNWGSAKVPFTLAGRCRPRARSLQAGGDKAVGRGRPWGYPASTN